MRNENNKNEKEILTQLDKRKLFVKHCCENPKDVLRLGKATILYGTKGLKARAGELARKEWEKQKKKEEYEETELLFDVKFSIAVLAKDKLEDLKRTIKSVENQSYDNWELYVTFDRKDANTLDCIGYIEALSDKRIRVFHCPDGTLSEKKNAVASVVSGQYLLWMDEGDFLSPRTLKEFGRNILKTNADIIYSDEKSDSNDGQNKMLKFKPDWSPELFLSCMYLGVAVAVRLELFKIIGGFRDEFGNADTYDLILRMIEHTDNVQHVSKILYSRRNTEQKETARTIKEYSYNSKRVLQSHLDRMLGDGAAIAEETEMPGVFDIRYSLDRKPLVSIIMPTKDHVDDVRIAVDSICANTLYDNYEIIILDNNSEKEETRLFFEDIQKEYDNVRVVKAEFEFNWSKLNNYGMQFAKGEVFIFLNNDVKVIEPTWMERLVEQTLQPEIGIAGGLLLYEDNTIQHAGIVVGMGGWADHVYKGANPSNTEQIFISPLVTRNVMGCTGACMAISRKVIQKIGGFDERFIICGSDVEMCIRAIDNGYRNVYIPKVKLYHYESKSRDSFIPQIDFELSDIMYSGYRKGGDPYYNINLRMDSCIPQIRPRESAGNEEKRVTKPVCIEVIRELHFKKEPTRDYRLNLVLPALNKEYVFGGISTALSCFEAMGEALGCATRIILVDAEMDSQAKEKYGKKYTIVDADEKSDAMHQIVSMANRKRKTLLVSENDQFMFTAWWTAYIVQAEYRKWKENGKLNLPSFLYLIQDYEPGFYAWSPRYVLAEATYRYEYPQIAIFNSSELKEYILKKGYTFEKNYCFDPLLNSVLKSKVQKLDKTVYKRKQILVYGRPSVDRNAFEIIVEALRKWIAIQPGAGSWTILSAGEQHDPVELGEKLYLESVGKLTLEEYAKILQESYAGISLMVSPHPSYPPLEMAVFDVQVITNSYSNKDMSYFSQNIHSVDNMDPVQIANVLKKICSQYRTVVEHKPVNENYVYKSNPFGFIDEFKIDMADEMASQY